MLGCLRVQFYQYCDNIILELQLLLLSAADGMFVFVCVTCMVVRPSSVFDIGLQLLLLCIPPVGSEAEMLGVTRSCDQFSLGYRVAAQLLLPTPL